MGLGLGLGLGLGGGRTPSAASRRSSASSVCTLHPAWVERKLARASLLGRLAHRRLLSAPERASGFGPWYLSRASPPWTLGVQTCAICMAAAGPPSRLGAGGRNPRTKPQAAPYMPQASATQPRPMSFLGRAGRPYRAQGRPPPGPRVSRFDSVLLSSYARFFTQVSSSSLAGGSEAARTLPR